ncbi:arp2/3 complex subunit [Coemansia sp. RSA 2706]|nr:arp2/3 complex subunit [Coemansia sp. RSA 2708]KAJ1834129.1 arp2/3 complex subunit [Coemansia sp. RSA 2711]KAJ2306956.1 arp2/3 complex subunit [Coemansia sp. RSA 2706]KAJ2313430.1 arp2/3 complex subunit [Coemansia sp. RSA 2705]KAJ2321081.1 arp2/3 complex subunit [Coemansia sp. RSA 2704]KAJ2328632.1 arp2/3 complex subunit [Coemansia sp. RSA 2702]KAJ2367973.1 arp2/3 complex subunit [Coemansia sp. RSA 2610]KAJ2392292.1 arp2/3 complex subunit [Coemansia sp. RSA 2611]KAJ2739008.1 arp2/3 compl
MAHRKLEVDNLDAEQQQMAEQLQYLSTRSHDEVAALVDQKSAAVRAAITRGSSVEALEKALADPPYGRGLEAAQSANAQLVSEIMMATRAQDIGGVVGSLSEDQRDVLLKYIYHGLARPAEFNCGVLLGWHERVAESGGLGSIVRVMSDRKTV